MSRPARPTRRSRTQSLLIALFVTAAVVVPLGIVASQASPAPTTEGITYRLGSDERPLDGAEIAHEAAAVVWLTAPDLRGIAWTLYQGDVELASNNSAEEAVPIPLFRTDALDPGTYDVYATIVTPDGDRRLISTFEIED